MNRIEFVKQIGALVALGVPFLSISGCSTEVAPTPNSPNPDPKDCLANGTSVSISANHGHSITVSKTDVDNAVEKTYSIQGSSTHNHSVTITVDQFNSLKSNQSIQIDSATGGGHTHTITVSCV